MLVFRNPQGVRISLAAESCQSVSKVGRPVHPEGGPPAQGHTHLMQCISHTLWCHFGSPSSLPPRTNTWWWLGWKPKSLEMMAWKNTVTPSPGPGGLQGTPGHDNQTWVCLPTCTCAQTGTHKHTHRHTTHTSAQACTPHKHMHDHTPVRSHAQTHTLLCMVTHARSEDSTHRMHMCGHTCMHAYTLRSGPTNMHTHVHVCPCPRVRTLLVSAPHINTHPAKTQRTDPPTQGPPRGSSRLSLCRGGHRAGDTLCPFEHQGRGGRGWLGH